METKKLTTNEILRSIFSFLLGFIGLNIIAIIFSFIYAGLAYNFEELADPKYLDLTNSIINFASYATALGVLIPIVGLPNIKNILSQFKISKEIRDGIAIGIIILCATMLYSIIAQQFIEVNDNQNEDQVNSILLATPILSTLTVAILGPVVEEFTYRFGLFRVLKNVNRPLAYLGTIIIFALIHFSFTTDLEQLKIELINLPSYMIAASLLCYAYDRHNSLACSIAAHITNNVVAVVSTFIVASLA